MLIYSEDSPFLILSLLKKSQEEMTLLVQDYFRNMHTFYQNFSFNCQNKLKIYQKQSYKKEY